MKISPNLGGDELEAPVINPLEIPDRPVGLSLQAVDLTESPKKLLHRAITRARLLHSERENALKTAAQEKWSEKDPLEFIDSQIDLIPDDTVMSSGQALLAEGSSNDPTELELYLISRAPELSLPELDQAPSGALDVFESLRCMRDRVRTKFFLQGIRSAVRELEDRRSGAIEVCDAGSGAVSVLGIYAALCSQRIGVMALELNPHAAQMSRQIVEAFGLSNRVQVVEADATTYQPSEHFDLLVSETMDAGLTSEPLVEIMSNLKPHLRRQGIVLPSAVHVEAAAIPINKTENASMSAPFYGHIHPVVRAAWQHILKYRPGDPLSEISFSIPGSKFRPDGSYLALASRVEIGKRTLDHYQSMVTSPHYAVDLSGHTLVLKGRRTAGEVHVHYRPGQIPNMRPSLGGDFSQLSGSELLLLKYK